MAYTVAEAAKQIGKSPSWVRGKCDRKEILANKVYDANQKREVWMVDDAEVERLRLEQLGKMNLTQDAETGALAPVPVAPEDPQTVLMREMFADAKARYDESVEYLRNKVEELQTGNGVLMRENGELTGRIDADRDRIAYLERRILELQTELKAERRKGGFIQKLFGTRIDEPLS